MAEDFTQRFFSLVDVKADDECWNWMGSKDRKGYGHFGVKTTNLSRDWKKNWKIARAHRVAYEMLVGEIVDTLDHVCKNTSCVNPNHLRQMSRSENTSIGLRGSSSYRTKLTEEDVTDIRIFYSNGIKNRDISRMYKLTPASICDITSRRTWRHL